MEADKNEGSSIRDLKVDTLAKADEMGPIVPTGCDEPATEQEVVETTIMVNPDPDSMESRG